MDKLDKKSQKGLEFFSEKGNVLDVKSSLDGMIDQMFDEEHNDRDNESNENNKRYNIKWIWMALAILLLGLVGYLGFEDRRASNKNEEPTVLFAQYFVPMDDITSEVSRSDTVTDNSSVGMRLYNARKFEKASAELFANEDKISQVYGALSLLNAGHTSEAIAFMENQLRSMDYEDYHDIIRWYYSLAVLQQGDKKKAINQLQFIKKSKGYKNKEAAEILDELYR